ncbi:hypothetical protein BXZ70DRAFT_1009290 [Cristinia sonorae]|uniref:Uncharacterized protein n=1 Tax=Cristinia sonorae TaxID=1940300 RepID=A0A8K0XNI1_9AGAR|nr:hypothetical protein BXZ70DRAFT_1009290 [Cristinia sonorae]
MTTKKNLTTTTTTFSVYADVCYPATVKSESQHGLLTRGFSELERVTEDEELEEEQGQEDESDESEDEPEKASGKRRKRGWKQTALKKKHGVGRTSSRESKRSCAGGRKSCCVVGRRLHERKTSWSNASWNFRDVRPAAHVTPPIIEEHDSANLSATRASAGRRLFRPHTHPASQHPSPRFLNSSTRQ